MEFKRSTISDFISDILLVYLDVILIYANNLDEHLQRLEKKCTFCQRVVEYSGHKISVAGINNKQN